MLCTNFKIVVRQGGSSALTATLIKRRCVRARKPNCQLLVQDLIDFGSHVEPILIDLSMETKQFKQNRRQLKTSVFFLNYVACAPRTCYTHMLLGSMKIPPDLKGLSTHPLGPLADLQSSVTTPGGSWAACLHGGKNISNHLSEPLWLSERDSIFSSRASDFQPSPLVGLGIKTASRISPAVFPGFLGQASSVAPVTLMGACE